ncbi:hypothetical protein MKW98_024001 [Papaver atlanticum]|uniref:Gnk2-homologous domain-containing protein n=1 Tax=Papaver atlanticum TaxID=357466 RepID=A0AAD4XL80_9MAGN|nr:hypothetical protein MKW98_024001 [Papaver atlanticum]
MGSYIFRFAVILLIHMSNDKVIAQPTYERQYYCQGDNYPNPSQFQVNLNKVLSSLSSNITTTNTKFFYSSIGENLDKVYGILLCRGDITRQETCKSCVEIAILELSVRCPNKKEYVTWYTHCMLRYSYKNIFYVMETEPELTFNAENNFTNMMEFKDIVIQLMEGLVRNATTNANHDETLFFATGSSTDTVYGLVQCTTDISTTDCSDCLMGAVSDIDLCCYGKRSGLVLRPSCNIRYDSYPFYESKQATNSGSPPSSPPPPKPDMTTTTEDTKKDTKSSNNIVPIVAISVVIALVLISTVLVHFYLKKKKAHNTIDDGKYYL